MGGLVQAFGRGGGVRASIVGPLIARTPKPSGRRGQETGNFRRQFPRVWGQHYLSHIRCRNDVRDEIATTNLKKRKQARKAPTSCRGAARHRVSPHKKPVHTLPLNEGKSRGGGKNG